MNIESRYSYQRTKLPAGTPIPRSGSKVTPAPTKNTPSYGRSASNRAEVTTSSERGSSVAESKIKTPLQTTTAQSRRSSFTTKPNTNLSLSSKNPRRNSLPEQRDGTSNIKRIDTGLKNLAKALDKPSIQTTGIVGQSKSNSHQIQPKNTNLQSQKRDTAATGNLKTFKHDKSRLTNIQTSKYLQNRPNPQSNYRVKTSASSVNQLPQGTRSKQTLNKEKISNRSNETISMASASSVSDNSTEKLVEGSNHAERYEGTFESSITHAERHDETFESLISHAATEFSTEEQRVSYMDCKPPGSDTSPINDGEAISNLDNIESLSLKETGNEKFACDEVENSSMISAKDNEDPLNNPGVSEMPTIIFDNKAFLEERRNKEFFEFYRNDQIIMNNLFRVKNMIFEIIHKAEFYIMEVLFLAKQEPPEIYSQIQKGAILLCSEMEKEAKKLIPIVKEGVEELKRLMNKSRVEEFLSLKGGDRQSLQANELEVFYKESNHPDDNYSERKGNPQEFTKDEDEEKEKKFLILTLQHKEVPNKFGSLSYCLMQEFLPSLADKTAFLSTLQNIVEFDEQREGETEEQKRSLERESKKFSKVEGEDEESKSLLVLGDEEPKNPVKGEAEVKVTKKVETKIRLPKPLKSLPKKSVMSYLPNDEGIELPFLDNVKEAIGKSVSHSKEEDTETFLDEKKAIELSLQHESEGKGEESKKLPDLGVEKSEKLAKDKAKVKITKMTEVQIEVPKKLPEPHLETSLLKSPQKEVTRMSHLPNDEGVELPFLDNVKEAIGKPVSHSKEEDTETFLDEEKAIELSLQHESEGEGEESKKLPDLGVEKSEKLAKDKAKVKITKMTEVQIEVPKKLPEPHLETSLLKSPQKEVTDVSHLPNDEGVEVAFLDNVKEAIGKPVSQSLYDKKVLVDRETVAKDSSNKQQQSEVENMGNIQKEGDVEVEKKAMHQQSVRKKTSRTQETVDISNYSNKEEIAEESINKSSSELKLTDKEEKISEKITPKREIDSDSRPDNETLLNKAIAALVAEVID